MSQNLQKWKGEAYVDEWDEFIGILANAISKYIDEMELDTLPDPEPINETSSVVLNKNMSNE